MHAYQHHFLEIKVNKKKKKEEKEAKHAQTSLDSLVSDDMRPWILRYR